MEGWRKVNKSEFDAFIAAYPRRLRTDVARMCEPPLLSYNDFTIAPRWPESIVAKVVLGSDWPGGTDDCYLPEPLPSDGKLTDPSGR